VISITKINLRAELSIGNCIDNIRLIWDIRWIIIGIIISSYKVMQESCFIRIVDFGYYKDSGAALIWGVRLVYSA